MKQTTMIKPTLNATSVLILPLVLLLLGNPRAANADIFEYCDVAGHTVDFIDIMEMNSGSDPLFGQPEANSDSISMPGFGFNVSANGDVDFKQGLMEMTIRADEGQKINSISLSEFGSYFQFGDNTDVIAHTNAFVEIGGQIYDASSTFASSGSGNGTWNQQLEIMFPETEELRLVIDAQVLASAADGEVAFVDKIGMNVGISSITAVPEPELFGFGSIVLLSLMFARRRKKLALA